MAASLSDQAVLSQDPTFVSRVKEGLVSVCINTIGEAISLSNLQIHISRARFANQVMLNLNAGTPNWAQVFAITVATDASVIGDATQNGTVVLTTGNVAAQAALVTDAHITTAITNQLNSFIQLA